MYILQFDGMLRLINEKTGKTGLLGYGWLILNNDIEAARGFGLFAHSRMPNSNIAEYLALIEGLEALTDLRIRNQPVEIRGDAKCVIDQMKGIASVNSLSIQKLHRRASRLADRLDSLTWTWIPRNKNKLADKLSRRGLRQLHITPNAYENALSRLRTNAVGSGLISLIDLRVYTPC
jgi:ribonuclease HI